MIGGLITLMSGICYAELGAMMPKAGGGYVYLREAYGERVAFMSGCSNFILGSSGSIAALAVAGGGNPERLKSEAEFASLCGVAPLLASSGKTERHRLNRGGDRRANRALYQIAVTRMSYDQRTKDYVGKRKRDGKSKKEAIRCLKRYIAREVFRALRNPLEIKGPSWKDLRPARQALGITLVEAGKALNVGFQRVSYAETGRLMNVRFLEEYDAWLKSQAKRES